MLKKKSGAFKNISELATEIGLIDKSTGKPKTHVIRFWEKKFKILKPSLLLNKRKYYSEADIKLFRRVKTLLKDKGMTIKGAIIAIEKEYSVDYKKINNIRSENNLIKINKIIKELKKIL